MRPTALLPLLLLSSAALAQTADIGLDHLKEMTKTLSSDAFEGRGPGTAGEDKTVAYLAEQFAKAGLKPGVAGGWYQKVPLVGVTTDPSAHLDISGGTTPLSFAAKTDMVVQNPKVQEHAEIRDSEIVFAGYGIDAPEKNWNDFAGTDARGKTIIVLINDPDWEAKETKGTFNGRAMTYYGRWTYKFEEAGRQGAAAVFIVHDTAPAAYPFTVVQSSWSGTQYQLDSDGPTPQATATGWLTNDAARKLLAAAGKDLDQLTAAAKRPGFRAVPLGLKASITLDSKIERHQSRNVVGILPGKTRPDEYVLFTAHWDHFGRCAPVKGDDICNGALDNASGTAGLVALAAANAKAGPTERSQVYVAVTAEEQGLLGSRYYAEHPVYPLGRTVGGVNMDELNMLGRSRDITVGGRGKSQLDAYLERAAAAQGRTLTNDPAPEKGYYYRSDHFSFAKLGVPMLSATSGRDLVKGGTAAGDAAANDFEEHRYHQPSDEYDPNWDWSGAVQDLQLYFTIGRALGNSKDWPNWTPGDEFRAIRDKSRAGG